jgi:hypothetical protein
MQTKLIALLSDLKTHSATFNEVITFIESHYHHQPTAFKNGDAFNEATQNQGSAKVFAFAQLHQLTKEDTLYLFAEHYEEVLNSPNAVDHQNIRQFMAQGWKGIQFEGEVLINK